MDMDMSSLVSTLLSSSTVSGISQSTNTSKKEATSVLNAALPLLLNGAKEQSQNSATSAGFASALLSHGKVDASNIGAFLQGVDMADGGKIVNHLLGNPDAVAGIAKKAGVSKKKTNNILSVVAPLLMTLLGQQSGSGNSGANAALVGAVAASMLGNMDVGSLLGGLLGSTPEAETTTTTANGKKKKKKKKQDSNTNNNSGGGILNALLNLLRG